MLSMDLTPATVIIGLVVVALAVLAVRRLVRRGACDCHDHSGAKCTSAAGCAGCVGCGAAERMVADMACASPAHDSSRTLP